MVNSGPFRDFESIETIEIKISIFFYLFSGTKKIADVILKYGANVNSRSMNGDTPLHKAIWRGDYQNI